MTWEILSIQIARDVKVRRFTVRKAFSGGKTSGVTGQPFANASEGSNRIFNQTEVPWERSGI